MRCRVGGWEWLVAPTSRCAWARPRPITRSASPFAYASALSKKLTPASWAARMHASAPSSPTWLPNVTQAPNDSSLTFSPARPSLR